jgi:hypothetical protein
MTPEELEDIYGPLYRFSDHKIGDVITFSDPATDEQYRAAILWVQAPGQRIEGGQHHTMKYIMNERDPDTGQLFAVEPSDVLR